MLLLGWHSDDCHCEHGHDIDTEPGSEAVQQVLGPVRDKFQQRIENVLYCKISLHCVALPGAGQEMTPPRSLPPWYQQCSDSSTEAGMKCISTVLTNNVQNQLYNITRSFPGPEVSYGEYLWHFTSTSTTTFIFHFQWKLGHKRVQCISSEWFTHHTSAPSEWQLFSWVLLEIECGNYDLYQAGACRQTGPGSLNTSDTAQHTCIHCIQRVVHDTVWGSDTNRCW